MDEKNTSNIKKEAENVKDESKKVNINFFKKLKISIFDFDKYYIIAGESFKRTTLYLTEIIIIFSLIIALIFLFKIDGIFTDYNNYKASNDVSTYTYKVAEGYELTSKQLDILTNAGLGSIFVYLWIFTFIVYFITGLINALAISVLGIITEKFIGLPLKYTAVYAISVSALTLPTILQLIYIVVNFYTGFTMKYFQVMYLLITYVYILAAILMLKSNLIKRKTEVTKKIEKNGKEDTENS